jgi:hypothetical protein
MVKRMKSEKTRTISLKKPEVQKIMDDWCRKQIGYHTSRRNKARHLELYSRIFTLEQMRDVLMKPG